MIRRGCIYWARMEKRRPVLVVSPDYRNDWAGDVIVVPCSTARRHSPTHVPLGRGDGGLPGASVAKCEQVTTVYLSDLDGEALGARLPADIMERVERALIRALGISRPALVRHAQAALVGEAD